MGKFSNVLFASDYDHTLTGTDNVLRQKNLDAIRYFMSEGGIFTVASGRSIPLFRKRAALVPTNAPCILYNLNGYYDHLKALLGHMIELGLSTPDRQQGIYFASNLAEIRQILSEA